MNVKKKKLIWMEMYSLLCIWFHVALRAIWVILLDGRENCFECVLATLFIISHIYFN